MSPCPRSPGGYSDSIVITWYSDSTTVIAQQYSKCGSQVVSQNCPYSSQPIFSPTVGQWYHVALVFTPQGPTSTYNGTWTAYVNGGLAFTTQVVYPLPVYRQDSYIGGSDWTDAPISANFDAVRVYNYALQQTEVQGMANKYGLAAPPSGAQSSSSAPAPSTAVGYVTSSPSTTSSPSVSVISSSSAGSAGLSSSSSSSLSGGAIAGIVIGAVVGAALVLLVLCFLLGVGRRAKKSTATDEVPGYAQPSGGYSRSDESAEASQAGTTDEPEVEMGEVHSN